MEECIYLDLTRDQPEFISSCITSCKCYVLQAAKLLPDRLGEKVFLFWTLASRIYDNLVECRTVLTLIMFQFCMALEKQLQLSLLFNR